MEREFLKNCEEVRFLKVTIPKKKDIRFKIIGEDYENCLPRVFEYYSPREMEHCQRVYGRKIAQEEWDCLCKGKEEGSMYIAGEEVETKYFGNNDEQKIYVIGACIISGYTVPEDKESFLYCLHEELKDKGREYSIIGIVVPQIDGLDLYRKVLASLTIRENDMVISMFEDYGTYTYAEGKKLNLAKVYDEREEYWFYDSPIHTNYAGNKAIAKAVADSILSYAVERKIPGGGGICRSERGCLVYRNMRRWNSISGR